MLNRPALSLNAIPLSHQFSACFLKFVSSFSTDCPSSSQSHLPIAKFKLGTPSSNDDLNESLARVPCHYISSSEQLRRLGLLLDSVREFAFDLEHTTHFHKKQQTCLLQISTRREDFIVDILKPQVRSKMHLLKKPFENERIVKVAHGSNDIVWLQRDFCIETKQFVNTLTLSGAHGDFPGSGGLSLDRLICLSCGVRLYKSKTFIAGVDWTVRPLPARLIKYARLDTHFLLDAYDFFAKEFADLSQPVKFHRAKMARAFAHLHYSLSDNAARRFRDHFLPIWRQSKGTKI